MNARPIVWIPLALLLTAIVPGRVAAQFDRPEPPGTLVIQKPAPSQVVEKRAEDARWRLGALRLDPFFSLANLTYKNNVFDTPDESERVSDLRGGAGAGFNGYFYLGKKTVVAAFARADYVWWLEQEELRRLFGSFGATAYGFFNRLEFEVGAAQVQRQQDLGTEVRTPVDLEDNRAFAMFEIEATGALQVVGSGETGRIRYETALEEQVGQARLDTLSRDTDRLTLGLQYDFRNGFSLGLGGEWVEQTFVDDPAGRSNISSGPVLTAGYTGKRLGFDVIASYRTVEFEGRDTSEDDLQKPLGRIRFSHDVGTRSEVVLYTGRRLFASVLNESSFSISDQIGVAFRRDLGRRVIGRIFVERQIDDYREISTEDRLREETTDTIGFTFDIPLTQRFRLRLGATSGRRDSTEDVRDATSRTIVSSISFGDDLLPW